MRNAQAESTYNPFLSDGSGKPPLKFDEIIPADYKDKEWVKNISKSESPIPELFKQVENLQSLIGRKQEIQVPGEGATPEQIKAFRKALNVPDDIKGYESTPIEWAPEDKPFAERLKSFKPEATVNELKKEALEAGMPKQIWDKLEQRWDKLTVEQMKQDKTASLQADRDFDSTMTRWFGEQKMNVIDKGNKLLSEFVPAEMKGVLAQQSNDSLALLAAVTNNIYSRLTREDSFTTGTGTIATTASPTASRQEVLKITEQLQKMNPMSAEYERLAARRQQMYNSLSPEALRAPLNIM